MYKNIIFLVNILIAIALMCSCDTGTADSDQLCKVSFAEYSQDGRVSNRIISVTNPDPLDGATYWYKATPLWTSSFGSVRGTVVDWTEYEPGDSLGYFAVGPWKFEVKILSSAGYLIYSGDVETNVNPGTAAIDIEVEKISDGVGTLSLEITVPTVIDEDDVLEVSYGLVSDMLNATDTVTFDATEKNLTSNKSTFTADVEDIDAGVYWVSILYKSDSTHQVGGVTTCVEIVPEETSTVSGNVEAGVWQSITISLAGAIKEFGITLSAAGGATSIDSGDSLVFTCTKTANSTDIVDYMWFVDGVQQDGATGSTFTFSKTYDVNADNGNYYRINCIAGDGSTPQLCASALWHIVVNE